VNLGTGAVTPIGNSGVGLTDIAFSPSKELFGETFTTLYSINQTTGVATAIGDFGGSADELNGLVFSQNGTLYGSGGTGLYTINTTTGTATLIGNSGLSNFVSAGDLAFVNGTLYEAVTNGSVSDLAKINPTTGAAALVGQVTGDPGLYGLVTGSNGVLYGVDGTNIYSIDTTTGAGTLVQSYNSPSLGAANGAASLTEAVPTTPTGLACFDTTAGQSITVATEPYSGPVSGLTSECITTTPDSLNISTSTPNWFIHTGSGNDAIAVSSGTNVMDGGTGSNFLTGGSGTDTFFVDDRGPTSDIWSTVNNFHSGDAATIWGVTPNDFALSWVDGQGATGYTGLTLHATAAGVPTASLTLAGFTSADLTNGKLTVTFGSTAASGGVPGSTYMYVHAN
jgi:Ca2+-binding RTX toxin-like protein